MFFINMKKYNVFKYVELMLGFQANLDLHTV
jgi:hypothetical protein